MFITLPYRPGTISNINRCYISESIKRLVDPFESLFLTATIHCSQPSKHERNRVKGISSYIEALSDTRVVDEQKYLASTPSARSSIHLKGI